MKLKKRVKNNGIKVLVVIAILLFAIFFINGKVEEYKYKKTYEYKLLQKNYSKEDTSELIKLLSTKELDAIIQKKYNKHLVKLIKEEYFLFKNIDRYLAYYEKNKDMDLKMVVSMVNVHRDDDYYENIIKSDTSLNELVLSNKYYYLDKDYKTDDIVSVSSLFAYEGNSLKEIAYSAFKSMCNDAKEDGVSIIINFSYRSYETQEELWKTRETYYGEEKADAYAARAGHSEHQTGLAVDLSSYGDTKNNFVLTPGYTWMIENCFRYGFILRYPEGKENITGYSYEPWHYRYVGIDVASKIHELNITFDEYYAYFIEK